MVILIPVELPDIPVTIPLALPTVAIAMLPLVQVPPGKGLSRVIVCATHTFDGPLIAATGLMFMNVAAIQPAAVV